MHRTVRDVIRGFTISRKRFTVPVLGILAAHVVVGLLVYYSLRVGVTFGGRVVRDHAFSWICLFSWWDSRYYFEIARNWYPSGLDPLWAFSPLYPEAVRVLGFLGVDLRIGGFAVAVACCMASITVFQRVAEHYMVRTQALIAALLYFLFPPVFLFSFVSYPESMFVLLALLCWYFNEKHSDLSASVAAGLCALSRSEGILVIIALLCDYAVQKRIRNIGYVLVPLSAIGGWELYGYVRTGVWFPSLAAQEYWNTPKAQAVRLAIQKLVTGNLSSVQVLFPYRWLIVAIIATFAIVAFVAWRTWKIDRALSMYLIATTVILASTFSVAYRSFPRILSFIFPVGLPMHTKKLILLGALVLVFMTLDYVAWLAFLTDGFY